MAKQTTGSYLKTHPTRITGVLLVVLGSLQAYSEQIRALITPEAYAVATIVVGVIVAALGYWNAQQPPAPEAIARDHEGNDGEESDES
jgi:hypothetical protein